ncbi:muscular LMNA-interacting protein isoform X1 [Podarcis raffonei]|uniref:muscular LMNA-interacting protein isoform X1 n=1 Tax=Podarcis raffonei TaxID=65483 RepID=UPI0023295433|nr:muscular LMNA-interacting protein isoform X1 [Podarcis raffonei]XP_053237055.1 muscular LMNA-interacting protein isoform X1 [Podarcis raffonei]
MELGKHKPEASTRNILWNEKLKVPSESEFLRFTFVPSFGRLPTQFYIADATTFLAEGLVDRNSREITGHKAEAVPGDQVVGSGNEGNGGFASCTNSRHKLFQAKDHKASRGEMEGDDLFKAEFVFITDSDEDKNTPLGNGYGHGRSKGLDASCLSPSGESRGHPTAPQLPLHTEISYSSVSQQKQSQLTSPLSTSDHPSYKPLVAHLLFPTNLTVEQDPSPAVHQASSLQESHSQWQSANGSSVRQTSTYLQSTASYSLPSPILQRPSFPSHSLSDGAQLPSGLQARNLPQKYELTSSPLSSKDSCPSSPQAHSSADTLQSSSPQAASPLPPKRFAPLSVVPIYITTHLLSPSPKPLSSPLHGSSSTIYSVNNPGSQMSSSGNLLKSGTKSPLPTRLSLLTAILKSGSTPKRPFSPASCPATFSPNSLGSSTLAIDQKFKMTPPTPKKAASEYSIRSASPSQEEFRLSVFSTMPNRMASFSKSSPTLRTRSPSPKKHLDTRALSPDKLCPLSPTISSYRKTVVSPLLQSKSPTFSLPPHAPRKGAHSPAHKARGPEKSKKVHTYSPTFTAKSYPLSPPGVSQRDAISPTADKGSLSPTVMHSSCRSNGCIPQAIVKDPATNSPGLSPHWQASHTDSTSPTLPGYRIKAPSPHRESSSVHSNFRACPPSSRPRTPTVPHHRSPATVHSPCSLLSGSREVTSPLSFSLPSASENKKPQSHKIKTSYKAFAAIPTNTLLLEQKALDEPAKAEEVAENKSLDTHSEMCSPAQLRQQTEELCAAIDQVLQDPLSMRRCESSPGSLQNILDSDAGKTLMSSQRPAGRETRFANLRSLQSAAPEKQKTKPGVIRPTMVKAKIITLKEEEPAQPNPFRKYLEETSGLQTEQDSSLSHPYLYTKLSSPTKSPLHPQGLSHADLLTPGPFNHLGSIFGDIHDSSYSPYRRNNLYNKPTHPIVPIPENEALSSKELCSARAQNKLDLLPYQENKDLSRGNAPDNGSPHSRAHCLPRGDFENVFAKTT